MPRIPDLTPPRSIDKASRSRAQRIRRKVREHTATEADRAWLDQYNAIAGHPAPPPRDSHPPIKTLEEWDDEREPTPVAEESIPPVNPLRAGVVAPPQPETSIDDSPRRVVIDFSRPQRAPAPAAPATIPLPDGISPKCGNANCASCYGPVKEECPVKHTPIYPKLRPASAEAFTRMIFGSIDFFMEKRFDVKIDPAPEARVKATAEGMRGVIWKHAGWVALWDDELTVAGGLYGHLQAQGSQVKEKIEQKRVTNGQSRKLSQATHAPATPD